MHLWYTSLRKHDVTSENDPAYFVLDKSMADEHGIDYNPPCFNIGNDHFGHHHFVISKRVKETRCLRIDEKSGACVDLSETAPKNSLKIFREATKRDDLRDFVTDRRKNIIIIIIIIIIIFLFPASDN